MSRSHSASRDGCPENRISIEGMKGKMREGNRLQAGKFQCGKSGSLYRLDLAVKREKFA